MVFWKLPGKPFTRADWAVFVWLLILGPAALGVVCLYFAFQAPASKAAEAAELRWYGFGLIAAGLGIWLIKRLVFWLVER